MPGWDMPARCDPFAAPRINDLKEDLRQTGCRLPTEAVWECACITDTIGVRCVRRLRRPEPVEGRASVGKPAR